MCNRVICSVLLFLSLQSVFHKSYAQETGGRETRKGWAVGGRVGVNLWLTDYKDGVGGDGWELMLRYGLTRWFSFGLQLGYEELKASNKPNIPGLLADYIKLHSFPASFVGTIHLLPKSNIAPFFYFGVGGIAYQRKDGLSNFVGGRSLKVSYHIPVGIGVETFLFSNVSFVVDGGYRLLDDRTDLFLKGGNDSYLTAKAGLNWYFGKKRHCREINDDSDDPDKDGLNMDQEAEQKTDPCNRDTDGDGLSDGEEVQQYKTNPLVIDTDDDRLSDGDEVKRHGTNPLVADTDGDGLSDGDEVLKHETEPRVVDTDGDSLSDGDEVRKYHTSALKMDTDGDGCRDNVEVKIGTNPLDSTDCKGEASSGCDTNIDMIVANFEVGQPDFLAPTPRLTQALDCLRQESMLTVKIVGHADSTGSDSSNFRLSRKRAEAVKTWLSKQGISEKRMTTEGKGSRAPIAPNDTEEGRKRNRRVEILWK